MGAIRIQNSDAKNIRHHRKLQPDIMIRLIFYIAKSGHYRLKANHSSLPEQKKIGRKWQEELIEWALEF